MNSLLYGSPNPAEYDDCCSVCEKCNGNGAIYVAYNIETDECLEVTKNTYNILPKSEGEALASNQRYYAFNIEICTDCKGEGVIQIEDDYWEEFTTQRELRW